MKVYSSHCETTRYHFLYNIIVNIITKATRNMYPKWWEAGQLVICKHNRIVQWNSNNSVGQ